MQQRRQLPRRKAAAVVCFQLPDDPVHLPRFAEHRREPQLLPGNLQCRFRRGRAVGSYGAATLLPRQKVDAAVCPALHYKHLYRGVAVPHCCPRRRVGAGALVLHPVVQRIQLRQPVRFRLRHKVRLGARFLFLLRLLIYAAHFLPLRSTGSFPLPAVDLLHQRRDLLRQPDAPGQKLPGAPEQPLSIYRLAARIKGIFPGVQHRAAGLLQWGGAAAAVTVQSSDALQQQIHGAKLCNKNVQINVQRLLHHLCAHYDQVVPALRCRALANACHQLVFPRCAVRHQELRMEQLHLFVRQAFPQHLRDLLRFFDRVDDYSRAAALCQLPAQQRGQLRLCERGQLHRFTGCVWWDGRLLYLCAVRPCQQRIAAAGFPWGVRDSLFLLVSLDQFRAPPGRQGG